MRELGHLSAKKVELVRNELWRIRGALRGVGATLQQQSTSPCYECDELFGLGQLFEGLSEQLARLEDILNCGYDSMALTKDKDIEEDDTADEDDDGGDMGENAAIEKIEKDDSGFAVLMKEFTKFLQLRRDYREANSGEDERLEFNDSDGDDGDD